MFGEVSFTALSEEDMEELIKKLQKKYGKSIKFESVVNEAKKFGNWSVTREDENQIKLVNQNTLDDLYVHKSKGKFEISYKGNRIIKPSLKQAMNSVLKLDR